MICIICQNETTKYKCPKCFDFYCSVICCKKHKEIGCEPKQISKERSDSDDDEESKLELPFTTEDTVDPQKLAELAQSDDLKSLLYNPHLRNFLIEVDKAPKAWNAMKLAMQEPLFLEFADECLKILEPETDD